MKYFWYTKQTLEKIAENLNIGYSYFSLTHFVYLLIAAVFFTAIALIYKKASEKGRKIILIVLAALLIADELFKDIPCILTNQFLVDFLPLHLCSINIFVALLYVIKQSKLTADWLYCLCLPGALIALLLPSWKQLPILNFMHIHSYSVHCLLALFPILLLVGGHKPNPKNLWKCGAMLVCICVPIYFLNKWLGTNFFFLNNNDETSPLVFAQSEAFLGGYGYLLVMLVGLALLWTLLYVPWAIAEKRKKV